MLPKNNISVGIRIGTIKEQMDKLLVKISEISSTGLSVGSEELALSLSVPARMLFVSTPAAKTIVWLEIKATHKRVMRITMSLLFEDRKSVTPAYYILYIEIISYRGL